MAQSRKEEIADIFNSGMNSWFVDKKFDKSAFVDWIWSQDVDVLEFSYGIFKGSDILSGVCETVRYVILEKTVQKNQN